MAEPNGLLAVGGDLSAARLLQAYRRGIFPWYGPGEPILWWSPSPRVVVLPNAIHVATSLRKQLRHAGWLLRIDRAFPEVISACAEIRRSTPGTWLSEDMQTAYTDLHRLGYAHSVEIWHEDTLIGGLYGIALGGVFFGESMFSRQSNTSKTALVGLGQLLHQAGFALIDCQVGNPHLFRMGAQAISRQRFERILADHAPGDSLQSQQLLWHQMAATAFPCEHFI